MSYENYHRFLQTLVATIQPEADADAQVAITGFKGVGKSTFALGAALRIEKFFGRKFSLEENVLWTYKDIMKGLTDESPIHAAVIDEAVLVAFNRNFGKQWQKKLVQLLNTAREYHKISFWNIPMFRRLDTGVREMFMYWVWIPRRGEALVFQRSLNPVTRDPWNLDYMDSLIKQEVRNECDLNEIIEALTHAPNFVMRFKFPKIEESLRQKYKELARKWKKALDEVEENKKKKEEDLAGFYYYVIDGKRWFLAIPMLRALFPEVTHNTIWYKWLQQTQHVVRKVINGVERWVVPGEELRMFVHDMFDAFDKWQKDRAKKVATVVAPARKAKTAAAL